MIARRSTPSAAPAADTCSNGQVAGHYSRDGYTIVWMRGEIDIATAPELMQELAVAVRAHECRVIVDLTQVTFMDSTGLNALMRARRREQGSGEIRLVGACRMVSKVLHMTGLDQIFPVHSTIEESIGSAVQHNGKAVNGTAVQAGASRVPVESP